MRRNQQRVPLSLHGFDLLEQQFEPIELAVDLRLEMRRQGTTIAGLEFFQPLVPITAQRLVSGYALTEKSPLMRLTCRTLSAVSTLRSRQRRRLSSSSGVGTLIMAHTRGSPRL